jgi:ribosome-associated translation inhibitor RaiA
MKINFHYIPNGIRRHLVERIEHKITDVFSPYDFITSIQVYLKNSMENGVLTKSIKMEMRMPHENLVARSKKESFEFATKDVITKTKRQLEKYKSKVYRSS